jgi:hypothetical protein
VVDIKVELGADALVLPPTPEAADAPKKELETELPNEKADEEDPNGPLLLEAAKSAAEVEGLDEDNI